MKDKENYVLVLNSQSATNRIGGSKRNYQYNINWSAILPKPQNINQKFLVKFTLQGMVTTAFSDVYSLNIDFGGANVYDQTNNKSTYLGLCFPVANQGPATSGTNTSFFYLITKTTDNLPVCIEYPNNSIITANFINTNNSSATGMNYDYILTLEFIPV